VKLINTLLGSRSSKEEVTIEDFEKYLEATGGSFKERPPGAPKDNLSKNQPDSVDKSPRGRGDSKQ